MIFFRRALHPPSHRLRICDMSWMAYCWREAFECEKLARVHEGRSRQEWLEAADHWFHESEAAPKTPPRASPRVEPAPVLSL